MSELAAVLAAIPDRCGWRVGMDAEDYEDMAVGVRSWLAERLTAPDVVEGVAAQLDAAFSPLRSSEEAKMLAAATIAAVTAHLCGEA